MSAPIEHTYIANVLSLQISTRRTIYDDKHTARVLQYATSSDANNALEAKHFLIQYIHCYDPKYTNSFEIKNVFVVTQLPMRRIDEEGR